MVQWLYLLYLCIRSVDGEPGRCLAVYPVLHDLPEVGQTLVLHHVGSLEYILIQKFVNV